MESSVVDQERVTWLRIFGIPCHAWTLEFFSFITLPTYEYMCMDDNTTKQISMDVAHILVRMKSCSILNEMFNVEVNGIIFPIKMVEEFYRPI